MSSSKYFFGCFNGCLGCFGLIVGIICVIFTWQFPVGKILLITAAVIIAIFAYIMFKRNNSVEMNEEENGDQPLEETTPESDESQLRQKAFFATTEDIVKNPSEYQPGTLDSYHRWIKDPLSEPEIENWFQENKNRFS